MIKNGVYVLKEDATVKDGFKLFKNQEIGVSNNVIYIGGHPLDTRLQEMTIKWMDSNQNLFVVDNRF